MLIFPTYQTMLAKAAATSSGGGSSIVDTDLYVHYDFSDTNCWNRTNGTNTDDYTIHNLANDYNDGLLRSRTGTSNAYRNASDSPCIDFNSSDGGGCLEWIPSNHSGSSDDCVLIIPGSVSSTTTYYANYNITTVSATNTNNLVNGIGTGAYTIEFWFKAYLDTSTNSIFFMTLSSKDTSDVTTWHMLRLYSGGYSPTETYGNKMNIYTGSWSASDQNLISINGAPSSGAAWSNWNHLVFSRNSSSTNDTKIYLNDSLEVTCTDDTNLDYMQQFYGPQLNWLAMLPLRQGIFRFYRGKALTSSEVTTNWNAQKSRFGH